MDKTYTITEVLNVRPNAYQGSTGIDFKVEGVEHKISMLTKYPDKVVQGGTLFGQVIPKEKDGRTYYNFQFGKKSAAPAIPPEDLAKLREQVYAISLMVKKSTRLLEIALPKALEEYNRAHPIKEAGSFPYPEGRGDETPEAIDEAFENPFEAGY